MRKPVGSALVSALTISTAAGLGLGGTAAVAQAQSKTASDYVVVYRAGASAAAARAAIKEAGGQIVSEQKAIGVASVRSRTVGFSALARRSSAVQGVARDRVIGKAPADALTAAQKRDLVEKERGASAAAVRPADSHKLADPLAPLQWDMKMIGATVDGSYSKQPGSRKVLVGVMDGGVDGSHPDIKPNFNKDLSRDFTTDTGPADVDPHGHGTHIASTIASPLNELGMAGVAPNVTLVNLRVGQDEGFFFLSPTVNALMYAADIGIDVVNMSFFIDPWLFNCGPANPAMWNSDPADPTSPLVPSDSPAEQAEQQTIIDATNRALHYAHEHRVTLVSGSGNEHIDLDDPKLDQISPDYPPGTERDRIVSNACVTMPTDGMHVLSVNSVGPSGRKTDYSNYSFEQTAVAAPGGWFRDGFGTPTFRTIENLILAAYPESVGRAAGTILPNGDVAPGATVVKDCKGAVCGYYEWMQGASMASPHAVGVVALIISQFGVPDWSHPGGITMYPRLVEKKLFDSATEHECPPGGVQSYIEVGRPADFDAKCEGNKEFNSFYGHGIVNANRAVMGRSPR